MRIEFVLNNEVSDEVLLKIYEIKEQNWPYGMKEQKKWMEAYIASDDIHVLLFNDNNLMGYANLVKRKCLTDNGIVIDVIGIGNVCVRSSMKKMGIGKKMILAINDYLVKLETCGVLFCNDNLVGFYNKFNWEIINPLRIRVDFNINNSNAMVYQFNNHTQLTIFGNVF